MNILNELDRLLSEEKKKLDDIIIPNDIELRLRESLNNIPKRKNKHFRGRVAVILIFVILLGYNMDTLAYYGKKLLGYDTVMNGTLQELNDLGKGQLVGKTHTFSDGVSVTLDGVMLDDNNLIFFYTIEDPKYNVEDIFSRLRIGITGYAGTSGYGGQGNTDSEGKSQQWIIRTDRTPKFYEQNIGLELYYTTDAGNMEEGKINFNLDRNAAVGKSISIAVNEELELDSRNIRVKSLVASPTSTFVHGEVQNILELGLDYLSGERFRASVVDMILLADGKEIENYGSGMRSDMSGTKFDLQFDAIPEDTKEIELKLKYFGGEHDTNELIKLNKDEAKEVNILGQNIRIEDVYEESGNTYITFTSEENTTLSKVYLVIDGVRHDLKETIPGDYEKVIYEEVIDGNSYKTTKIFYTRTMKFEGTGDSLELEILRIRYTKDYDKVIFSYRLDKK